MKSLILSGTSKTFRVGSHFFPSFSFLSFSPLFWQHLTPFAVLIYQASAVFACKKAIFCRPWNPFCSAFNSFKNLSLDQVAKGFFSRKWCVCVMCCAVHCLHNSHLAFFFFLSQLVYFTLTRKLVQFLLSFSLFDIS